MEEVEGFLNGELNYYRLRGGTGPLVYPAGFVYVYSILYYISEQGANILAAQYAFAVLYVVQQVMTFRSISIPTYLLILLCLSKRIHSNYVLRLFNDTFAVMLVYVSIYLLQIKKVMTFIIYSTSLICPSIGLLVWFIASVSQ